MSRHLSDCCCPPHGQCKTAVCLERRLTMMLSPARDYFLKSLFSSLFSRLRGDQRALCCIGCLRWNILHESCSHGAFNMLMSLSRTIESSSHSHSVKQLSFSWFTHCSWKTVITYVLLPHIFSFISFKPPSSCQPLLWLIFLFRMESRTPPFIISSYVPSTGSDGTICRRGHSLGSVWIAEQGPFSRVCLRLCHLIELGWEFHFLILFYY